jgi:hypothetical protein
MRIKSVAATPTEAALAQPFVGSALPRMPGLPLGINTRLKSPMIFDPWWAHRLGIVNSPVYLVTGNKGFGKSTFQKVVALRYGARRGSTAADQQGQMRIRINDRKLEGSEPEYAKLVRYLGGRVVSLNREASINIFDPKMKMSQNDIVETAVNTCEMVSGVSPLPRFQSLALQVAIWKMLANHKDNTRPEILEAMLLGLRTSDIVDYYQATNEHVSLTNVPPALFEEDAAISAANIGEVIHGAFGGIFGGNNSLREMLSEHVVLLDWTGVPEKARTLLSAMLWKWHGIAQRQGDQELIPDMMFTDEEHQALRNLMYVRFMSASLKEARALRTAYFISSQHETDLTMAGDPESEIRNLSESIGLSIGGRFIFQQPENKRVLDIYRGLGFSELDVLSLPQLRRGSYFFHAPSHPPIPVHLVLTPIEAELSGTESAIKSMTKE